MSANQQVLTSYGAGAGSAGPLDSWTTDLWAACWPNKLLSAYAGPCDELRESGGDTLLDIGFSAGVYDQASAEGHAGANDAFRRTFYDQSGGGNHHRQTTTGAQPRVVLAGVYDGFARFDGSDDFLVSVNTSGGANTGVTVFLKGDMRSLTGTQVVFEQSTDSNPNDACLWYLTTGPETGFWITRGTGNNVWNNPAVNAFDDSIACVRFDSTPGNPSDKAILFDDGSVVAAGANVNGTVSGAFGDLSYYIGMRAGTSLPASLNLTGFVIYHAALSDADVASISTILATA